MLATVFVQADPAIVDQLERLATTQTVVAISVTLIALSAIAIALGALLAVRKAMTTVDQALARVTPRIDPLLLSASRVAHDAEHVVATAKDRLTDVLDTVEDLNGRLKTGASAVEERIRKFGAVVDVVQSETEGLLLDAASTARGVHTAAEVLRTEKRGRLSRGEPDSDSDA